MTLHGRSPARRPSFRYSTSLLLTCAALGVAGGLLLAPANWLSTVMLPTAGIVTVAIVGLWILPAVIALRLLRKPFVGILVGLISGLVIVPFSGYGFASVFSNLSWAASAELPFLVVLWRYWYTWQHYAGAVALAAVYAPLSWSFFALSSQPLWAQLVFVILLLASCLGGTALGILIADRLRKAGVGGRG